LLKLHDRLLQKVWQLKKSNFWHSARIRKVMSLTPAQKSSRGIRRTVRLLSNFPGLWQRTIEQTPGGNCQWGKSLFVADIKGDRTYRYEIGPDGTLSGKTLAVEHGSDGITLDVEGNLYITGDGVKVFDPQGALIDHIRIDEKWTANVTFGGKDRQTLFITASTSLYSIRLRVRGANASK